MRSWLIAAVAAIMLIGCASAHATAPVHAAATAHAAPTGPVPSQGSQAKALALAWHLVAELQLPPDRPGHGQHAAGKPGTGRGRGRG
jgi:hypothetical protein